MPTITYPNTSPDAYDGQTVTLRKILQATNGGAGSSGGGAVLSGDGAPSADPGRSSAIYYDRLTNDLYEWNDTTEAWV